MPITHFFFFKEHHKISCILSAILLCGFNRQRRLGSILMTSERRSYIPPHFLFSSGSSFSSNSLQLKQQKRSEAPVSLSTCVRPFGVALIIIATLPSLPFYQLKIQSSSTRLNSLGFQLIYTSGVSPKDNTIQHVSFFFLSWGSQRVQHFIIHTVSEIIRKNKIPTQKLPFFKFFCLHNKRR